MIQFRIVLPLALAILVVAPATCTAECQGGEAVYRRALEPSRSPEDRERDLRKAVERCPADPCRLTDLAEVLLAAGKTEEASGFLQRALAADPTFVPALESMGNIPLAAGDWWHAAETYAKAASLEFSTERSCEARDEETLHGKRCTFLECAAARAALALDRAGEKSKAADILARFVDAQAGRQATSQALREGASAAVDAGRMDVARVDLGASLQLEPDNAWTHQMLGVALSAGGDHAGAVSHLETAMKAMPGWAEPAFNLGHVQFMLGNYGEAADAFETAWACSKGKVNDRLVREMQVAEARAGRAGVMNAESVGSVLITRGIGLKVIYDDTGKKASSTSSAGLGTNEPIRDVWTQELPPPPPMTAQMEQRWGKGSESVSCNPEAPMEPKGTSGDSIAMRVMFDFGSASIKPESYVTLDNLSDGVLAGKATVKWIELVGHADCVGPADANDSLSRSRADAVAEYMMSRGVPRFLLRAEGMGFVEPRASNKNALGRSQNRRVELDVTYN